MESRVNCKITISIVILCCTAHLSMAQHFDVVYTGNPFLPMDIFVTEATINEIPLAAGDEIAILDGDAIVGVGIVRGNISVEDILSITASTDDNVNDAVVNGFVPGSLISYRIWDASAGEELDEITPSYIDFNTGNPIDPPVFASQGTAAVSLNAVAKDNPSPPPTLLVQAVIGTRRTLSPLRTRVNRRVRFEMFAFTQPDGSDRRPVTDFRLSVPQGSATQLLSADQVRLTTEIPDGQFSITETLTFEAEGATAEYDIIVVAGSIYRVKIEPQNVRRTEGDTLTFSASAFDRFGNAIPAQSFRWHTVGGIGEIHQTRGKFTASNQPGEGFVIAVAINGFEFGDTDTQVTGQGKVVVGDGIPQTSRLHPNAPNPFNPGTSLRYDLPRSTNVQLSIYNLAGQEIRRLVDGFVFGGFHQVQWDGTDDQDRAVGSGQYLVRLVADGQVTVRKVLLLR